MHLTFVPCRTSSVSKLGRYSAMYFFPFLSIALFFVPILIGIDIENNNAITIVQSIILFLVSICAVLLSIFLLRMSRQCYRLETRYIAIDQSGFTIRGNNDKRYGWENISSIGVIAYAANASKQIYQTEICIFIEPINQTKLKKLRDSYLYGALNLDRLVLLDYNASLSDMLTKVSHLPVLDHRPEQMKL